MASSSKFARRLRFLLASLVLAFLFFTPAPVASASEQQTQEAETLLAQLVVPERPAETHAPNPASQVPWPDEDRAACGSDSLISLAGSVCFERGASRVGDYGKIAAHFVVGMVGGYFQPQILPFVKSAVVAETVMELKKDGAYCTLATLIEKSSATPEAKKEAKDALDALIETVDTIGDIKQVFTTGINLKGGYDTIAEKKINSAKRLQKFWQKYYLNNPEDVKTAVFAAKNLVDTADTIGKVNKSYDSYFHNADHMSKKALLDAEAAMKECRFAEATVPLDVATREGLEWLKRLRSDVIAGRKNLRCVIESERQNPTPAGFGLPPVETARAELGTLENFEKEQVQFLQELSDLAQSVKAKQGDVEALRGRLANLITGAETATKECNWSSAESKIDTLKKQTTGGWCATLFGDQYSKIDSLIANLNAAKEKQQQDEKQIADVYRSATSSKTISCQSVSDAADSIDQMTKDSCVNAFEATAKVTGLRNSIAESEKTAESLQSFFNGAKDYLENCDGMNADAMADSIRAYLPNLKCVPSNMGRIPTDADANAIDQGRDDAVRRQKDLMQKGSELVDFAKRAAENCDENGRKAQEDQLRVAMENYLQFCKALPQGIDAQLKEIQSLQVKDKGDAEKALNGGKEALKHCDALEAYAAADQIEFIGDVCGLNATAEAQSLRAAADALSKKIIALEQNAAATRQMAQNAWQACDAAKVKWAASEMNRIVEAFSRECPGYPPGVAKDSDEVQKILQSANDLAAAEIAIKDAFQKGQTALNSCDPKTAKKFFNDAVTIFNNKVNNNQCQIHSVVQNAIQSGRTAANLLASQQSLTTALDTVDILMEDCPEDLTPVHDKLKRAESEITEIRKTGINCDVSVEQKALSGMRAELKEIEDLRNQVRAKVLLAQGFLDAQGANKSTAIEQANRELQLAENLLKNKREECYDALGTQIDLLRAALGAPGTSGNDVADLENDDEDGDFGDEQDFVDDEDFGDDDVGEVEDIPEDEEGEGDIADLGIEEIPDDNPVTQNVDKKQTAGGASWILESATVSPEKPDPGWSYGGAQASSAQLTIYNGDRAIFQWTPPPQQIDSNGFTISMNAQGAPADPRGRVAVLIGVAASGCEGNLPSDQWSAYGASDAGPSSASKSVTFKPAANASELEIRIGLMWGGLNFTYKYRRAS